MDGQPGRARVARRAAHPRRGRSGRTTGAADRRGPPGCGARRRRRGAREAAAKQYGFYGNLPNYERILRIGGLERSADACIVGDEDAVAEQLRGLVDAGATDVWAASFPVGDDRKASRARTRALLEQLVHD